MKNREGFVSNSSSSSFIAWGFTLTTDEFFSIVQKEFPTVDITKAKEDWDLSAIGYGEYPEEIEDWDLVKTCTSYEYESDEFHFGYEWDLDGSAPDVTKPLVTPEKQAKMQQLAIHYKLPKPTSTGGTRYS